MDNKKPTTRGRAARATVFDPRNDNRCKSRKASRATANANAATLALLDAIRDQLTDCATATWGDASDAQHTAHELLNLYASQSGRDSGETFDLPSDGGRDLPIRFTLEDF